MASRLLSFRAIATMLALTAVVSSCSDDDDDNKVTPTTGVSWTVDGANVTATNTQVVTSTDEVDITGTVTSGTNASIVMLTVPKTAGTYAITSTSDASATYVTGSGTTGEFYGASSGSIVVTSVSATDIVGTFSFTGTPVSGTATKALSNGKFNVKL